MSSPSRRDFLKTVPLAFAGSRLWSPTFLPAPESPLQEFSYADVTLFSSLHEDQLHNTHSVLMQLSEDSLLKPLRAMAGQPAPGEELGGWYLYDPDYRSGDTGFAPGAPFGQWVSALARYYAISGDPATREKVLRLNHLYAQTISGDFYEKNRFPAYCYDKLVCGLIDSHQFVHDPDAFAILNQTTDTALPHLPKIAVEHDVSWRPGTDETFTWDESYTISENLFLACQRGAGSRYQQLASQYLDDLYYTPLSEGHSNLAGRHAYSYVNSLCSAMQAYLSVGSRKHFLAAKNGFDFLQAQSFATGGWGPDEILLAPGSGDLFASLEKTHNSFETPCGAYAHFKLTRYLLRVTRDSLYGDSMERVMYNTILGAKPLDTAGHAFYYSDYNFQGKKIYKPYRWPCCSGTLPQIAADYRISAYLREERGVYVVLYIPSMLQWIQDGGLLSLKQTTSYPFDSTVRFDVRASTPKNFALQFRIPAWTASPSISVNGKRLDSPVIPGTFASVFRLWKDGDRVELDLPSRTRLEPVDQQHEDTVALLSGPLVLFGIRPDQRAFTRAQLLAAKKSGASTWQAASPSGPLHLMPFFLITDEPYTTYFKVTS